MGLVKVTRIRSVRGPQLEIVDDQSAVVHAEVKLGLHKPRWPPTNPQIQSIFLSTSVFLGLGSNAAEVYATPAFIF